MKKGKKVKAGTLIMWRKDVNDGHWKNEVYLVLKVNDDKTMSGIWFGKMLGGMKITYTYDSTSFRIIG